MKFRSLFGFFDAFPGDVSRLEKVATGSTRPDASLLSSHFRIYADSVSYRNSELRIIYSSIFLPDQLTDSFLLLDVLLPVCREFLSPLNSLPFSTLTSQLRLGT